MNFSRSRELRKRMHNVVPGGCHTYAKGDDQYPELAPGFISRGLGCHVWDVDGNEFIEYGMGLRAVTLGHAYPPVVAAARETLDLGCNFTRPAAIELECAETFLDIISTAEMVKFTKDGSTATTAAVKLARAYTGRPLVAMCAEQPFFSYDDWFIANTTMDRGVLPGTRQETLQFRYNDLESIRTLFDAHPGRIAAVILEPARIEEPRPGFLSGLIALSHERGAIVIFDEMITGFRWDNGGAQHRYEVIPDLSTFGKALANGFSVSALCGRRDLMRLGSRERPDDNVFLLSTTHGAETHALAAAVATIAIYQKDPVIEHLHRQGERLARGVKEASRRHGLQDHVMVLGRACNLVYVTRDRDGRPCQGYRTLFLQELIRRGVLAPSFVVSYSHTDQVIDRTVEAIDGALEIYARALTDGIERHLSGRSTRLVFDRRQS